MEQFIRDKYVNKRWIDNKMKQDPVTLYKTDAKKFEKYVKAIYKGKEEAEDDGDEQQDSSDEEQIKKRKKEKKDKKKKKKAEKKEAENAKLA